MTAVVKNAPDTTAEARAPEPRRAPSYVHLALMAAAFISGGVAILLFQNALGRETIAFSTTGLLGFLFGVALAAASTVLSIAAILLGKASEHVMIERSDASIRLQNEVFVKTTDALARIESSTGVTEKRIEDIISGRAGELSQVIAERITREGRTSSRATLEQEIRESLVTELSVSKAQAEQREQARKQAKEAEEKYRDFQGALLAAVANSGTVTCEKIGDGNFGSTGTDLFDGVFVRDGKRIGVSSFGTRRAMSLERFEEFVLGAARELQGGAFYSVAIVFDDTLKADSRLAKTFANVTGVMKPDIAARILLLDGPEGSAVQKLVEYFTSLPSPEVSLHLSGSQQPASRLTSA
jgi:hypothetical protein